MRTIDLNGTWRLSRARDNARTFEPLEVEVPCTVQSVLVDAERETEPPAWIGECSWRFTRSLHVDDALLSAYEVADLTFDGLDTLASVTLGGRSVLRANNAFRPWRVNVMESLSNGTSELAVAFRPATPATAPHKPAASFAHRGAPPITTVGIPRDVRLELWRVGRIAELVCSQNHDTENDTVRLSIGGWIEFAGEHDESEVSLTLSLINPAGKALWKGPARFSSLLEGGGDGSFTAEINIRKPRIWWPAGMGDQPLYTVSLELRETRNEGLLDARSARVGLRTLVAEPRPRGGTRLVVNGVPMFLRGAVWTQAHPYRPALTREDFAPLLTSARDGAFNALLLSGDSAPEARPFWDLCDELGLVVLGAATLGDEAAAGASDDDEPPAPYFLQRACVPDTPLSEPDAATGLCVVSDPVSLPDAAALADVFPRPADRVWNGPALAARSARPEALAEHFSALVREWPIPVKGDDWSLLSQLEQAREMRHRIACMRLDSTSAGFFWNPFVSPWSCVDASSIESDGRWKALQHEAARAFAPQALFARVLPPNDVRVTFLADGGTDDINENAGANARFSWRLTSMDGSTLASDSKPLVEEGASVPAGVLDLSRHLPDFRSFLEHHGRGSLSLWLRVTDSEGFVAARDRVLFAPMRDLALADPLLTPDFAGETTELGQRAFRITLCASTPAFGVTLSTGAHPTLFSENFFDLEPDEPSEIWATPLEECTAEEFHTRLRVRSLYDLLG